MYFCCNFCNFDLIKWTLGYELKTVCIFNIAFATLIQKKSLDFLKMLCIFQKKFTFLQKTLQSLQKNFTFFKNTLHYSKKFTFLQKTLQSLQKKLYIF